jgi:hypothetical protein
MLQWRVEIGREFETGLGGAIFKILERGYLTGAVYEANDSRRGFACY